MLIYSLSQPGSTTLNEGVSSRQGVGEPKRKISPGLALSIKKVIRQGDVTVHASVS